MERLRTVWVGNPLMQSTNLEQHEVLLKFQSKAKRLLFEWNMRSFQSKQLGFSNAKTMQCDAMQSNAVHCSALHWMKWLWMLKYAFFIPNEILSHCQLNPSWKKIRKTFEMNWNGLEVLFEQLNFVLNRTICSWSFAVFFQRKRRFWIISQSGNRKKANIRSSAIANSLRELPSINYKSLFLDVNSFSECTVRHSNCSTTTVCVCLCAVDTRTWRFQRNIPK